MTGLFTIGYEGLVQDQVIDLLAAAGVRTVLDVRAVPLSRKAGFSKNILGASLAARGIAYVHDRRLGTPKPGRDAARKGRTSEMAAIFEAHLRGADAVAGLAEAARLCRTSPTCLLCFERAAHLCHRAILAGRLQAETGQAVRHLSCCTSPLVVATTPLT